METKDLISIALGVFAAIPSYVMAFRRWAPERPPLRKYLREVRRSYPFLVGILLTIVIIALAAWPSPALVVAIDSPADASLVPRTVVVEGHSNRELPDGQHLYLLVECGGYCWPQQSEILPSYSLTDLGWKFLSPASVGLPEEAGKRFGVELVLVDEPIHARFQAWLQQGEWAGIPVTTVNQWGEWTSCDTVWVTRQ